MNATDRIDADATLESLTKLAHDFNNALAVILSNVGLAIEDLSPAHPVVTELREIEAAAQRAAKLTKTLARRAAKIVTLAPPLASGSMTDFRVGSEPLRIAR